MILFIILNITSFNDNIYQGYIYIYIYIYIYVVFYQLNKI